MLRAISIGLQANASPASHASARVAGLTWRTSAYIVSAVITIVSSSTTLKVATTPSHWLQRQREEIQERRVVVLREIGGRAERQDLIGLERIVPRTGFMLEHPLVPDIHTRIAAGIARERGAQVQGQRPREGERDEQIKNATTIRGAKSRCMARPTVQEN